MTRHFLYGCPWASGDLQLADTDQRYTWTNVTCKQCWKLKKTGYGRQHRNNHYAIDPKTGVARKSWLHEQRKFYRTEKEYLKDI
jgi:hypothetical protein